MDQDTRLILESLRTVNAALADFPLSILNEFLATDCELAVKQIGDRLAKPPVTPLKCATPGDLFEGCDMGAPLHEVADAIRRTHEQKMETVRARLHPSSFRSGLRGDTGGEW